MLKKLRNALLFCVLCLGPATASASEAFVPESLRNVIEGDWVQINNIDLNEFTSRRETYCEQPIAPDSSGYRFGYDQKRYQVDLPLLKDVQGQMALRWQSGDDLYILLEDNTLWRAVAFFTDLNGNQAGMWFSWSEHIDPKRTQHTTKYSYTGMFLSTLTNKSSGQSFLIAKFPTTSKYEDRPDTKYYLKCEG